MLRKILAHLTGREKNCVLDDKISDNFLTENSGEEIKHPETHGKLISSTGLRSVRVGNESALLYRNSKIFQLIPAFQADLVLQCRAFLTIEEHLQALTKNHHLPETQKAEFLTILSEAAKQNLLAGLDLKKSSMSSAKKIVGDQKIAFKSLAIITTPDRANMALRCAESILGSGEHKDREITLCLYDDSMESSRENNVSRVARTLHQKYGRQVFYTGGHERQAYRNDLAAAGIAQNLLDFLVQGPQGFGPRYGVSHNMHLLDTPQEPSVVMDDDTVCEIVALHRQKSELEFFVGDRSTINHFITRSEAFKAASPQCVDYFALHENLVGRNFSALDDGAFNISISRATDRMLKALNSETGRIAATWLGIYGDSAMGSSLYHLLRKHKDSSRQIASDPLYSQYISSRAVCRGVDRYVIADNAPFMTYACCLDLREFLPPFFPIGRNQDGLFAAMLGCINPDLFIAQLPYAIKHDPAQDRFETPETLVASATSVSIIDCLLRLLEHYMRSAVLPSSPQRRCIVLGHHFEMLSLLPPDEFKNHLTPLIWRAKADVVARLEATLSENPNGCAAWRTDVTACRDAILNMLGTTPQEIAWLQLPHQNPSQKLDVTTLQALIGQYGSLLIAWPSIVELSHKRRQAGSRIARPIQ